MGVFNRYQALSEALEIYLDIMLPKGPVWFTSKDIVEALDWEYSDTTRKKIIRLCHALHRIGRLERRGSIGQGSASFWRIHEGRYLPQVQNTHVRYQK